MVLGFPGSHTDDADDELRDDHACAAVDKEVAPAEALDHPEGDGGGADVDESGDEGDEEGVGDGTEGLEEDGSEVEDEVDTGQLLHHLHENTCSRSVSHY